MNFGPWEIEYDLEDGARISSLKFGDEQLPTTEPDAFRAPEKDYGSYEKRPVFGYDDCFPSVKECLFPGSDWVVPDHGEICWLPWKVEKGENSLAFTVRSNHLPAIFRRNMSFREDGLSWKFGVENTSTKPLAFLHVMHPLMPLRNISEIELPGCRSIYDEINDRILVPGAFGPVPGYLLTRPEGSAEMLYLQNVEEGSMSWKLNNGLRISMLFPRELFPTIGIWWNHRAYPSENNCRRTECAFEPVPASGSSLADAHERNEGLVVQAGESLSWSIEWQVSDG
jgi:hypothetical protein